MVARSAGHATQAKQETSSGSLGRGKGEGSESEVLYGYIEILLGCSKKDARQTNNSTSQTVIAINEKKSFPLYIFSLQYYLVISHQLSLILLFRLV